MAERRYEHITPFRENFLSGLGTPTPKTHAFEKGGSRLRTLSLSEQVGPPMRAAAGEIARGVGRRMGGALMRRFL
jgi:hypothetical protein